MALVQENNYNLLRVQDVQKPLRVKVLSLEKKAQYDKYKHKEVEKIFLSLSNGKIFFIQNEVNFNRIIWNFESIEECVGKEIVLYISKIEINGVLKDSIRIQYNILNKIKT